MTRSLNIRGTAKEVFTTSSTQSFPLGTRMHIPNGRIFRYSKASSTALAVGVCVQRARQNYQLANVGLSATAPIGATTLTLTVEPTVVSIDIDTFKDGLLFVNSGTGQGHVYSINGNKSYQRIDSVLTVYLNNPLFINLPVSDSRVTLLKNRFQEVFQSYYPPATELVGITPVAVAANNYFWLQTGGPCAALQEGELAPGVPITQSSVTPGAIGVSKLVVPDSIARSSRTESGLGINTVLNNVNNTVDERLVPVSGAAVVPSRSIGYVIEPVLSGQYCLVQLTLDV